MSVTATGSLGTMICKPRDTVYCTEKWYNGQPVGSKYIETYQRVMYCQQQDLWRVSTVLSSNQCEALVQHKIGSAGKRLERRKKI